MLHQLTHFLKAIDLKRFLFFALVIIALFGVGSAYYFYGKYRSIRANPYAEAQKEIASVVLAAGRLMELPQDETPTVATVSDKEKLRDQNFFRTAENGDVLLTYRSVMKAVLYRPSNNKIINVAEIIPGQSEERVAPLKRSGIASGTDSVKNTGE